MNNKEINDLKIRINELSNKIIETEEIKKKYNDKTEKLRKFAILNTVLACIIHVIGFFIHPLIIVVACCLVLLGVGPIGFVVFHREDVEEKLDKEIKGNKEDVERMNETLIKVLSDNQEHMQPLVNLIKEQKAMKVDDLKKETSKALKNKKVRK